MGAPVNLCETHGVCGIDKRKKACLPHCIVLRSNRCQARIAEPGGWGFRQCARAPLGTGYCRQHAAGELVPGKPRL